MSTNGMNLGGIRSIEDIRLRCRIDEETGCWLWALSINAAGMPQCCHSGRRSQYAHRVAYEFTKGEIRPGFVVYHRCEHNHCCNPDHLRMGPRGEQAKVAGKLGKMSKGVRHAAVAKRPPWKVTDAIAQDIRERVAAGETATALAKEYDIHLSHACRIGKGQVRMTLAKGASIFTMGAR